MAPGVSDAPVLWHLKVSPYNEKARWALDHKRVPHVRRAAEPGRHRAIARRLTGGATFPVLVMNGDPIGDSTRIIEALERLYPEPALYPADAPGRRRALQIEDYFDEQLGPHLRLLIVSIVLEEPGLALGAFLPDLRGGRRLAVRALFPLQRRKIRTAFGIHDESVEQAWLQIAAAGECFREELQPNGYLVGEGFSVADLTVAAMIAPAIAPPEFPYPQPQRGHPAFARLREAFDEAGMLEWGYEMYGRHRARSAEIEA